MKETNIILNEGQQEAVDLMVTWAKRKTFESTFTLSGSAGTGKTTVTNQFIRECSIDIDRIAVSAPTHKAKEVIQSVTGLQGFTLQSLLGLRPDTELANFDPNNPAFSPQSDPLIGEYKLIIIDECSMVNKELYDHLVRQSKIYGVKLLFLGDPNQLPPINEKLSKTFENKEFAYKLKQVVRQSKENPITELLDILQKDIENKTYNYVNYFNKEKTILNVNNEGYIITRHVPTFQEYLLADFQSQEFSFNIDYCKFLSYTNTSVNAVNKFIRKNIMNTEEELAEGDLLLCYKTYSTPDGKIITSNSKDYLVKSTENIYSSFLNCNCISVELFDKEYNEVEKRIFVKNSDLPIFAGLIEKKISQAKAKRSLWKAYFDFKAKYMVLAPVVNQYNKTLVGKDFDYGYGITVHKSQGSTYDITYLNIADILSNYDNEEKKKLLYVALSRVKTRCYMLIN
jgi:ATP-dependent exoDNAse (exonuclease V) alpha subunit